MWWNECAKCTANILTKIFFEGILYWQIKHTQDIRKIRVILSLLWKDISNIIRFNKLMWPFWWCRKTSTIISCCFIPFYWPGWLTLESIFTTFVEETTTGCQTAQNVSNVNKHDCDKQHLKRQFAVTMVTKQ